MQRPLRGLDLSRVLVGLRPTQVDEKTEVGAPGLDFQTGERANSSSLLTHRFLAVP
jgi:hypothetical protein